jgi:C4-dicarboxylate-specific signal transduction histidine kinase
MSTSTTSRDCEIYVARDATLGEFAASIAFEVGQPLAAISLDGQACLRWLDRQPADLDEVRTLATRIVADALRAGDIVSRLWVLAAIAEERLAPRTDSPRYQSAPRTTP